MIKMKACLLVVQAVECYNNPLPVVAKRYA